MLTVYCDPGTCRPNEKRVSLHYRWHHRLYSPTCHIFLRLCSPPMAYPHTRKRELFPHLRYLNPPHIPERFSLQPVSYISLLQYDSTNIIIPTIGTSPSVWKPHTPPIDPSPPRCTRTPSCARNAPPHGKRRHGCFGGSTRASSSRVRQ